MLRILYDAFVYFMAFVAVVSFILAIIFR